MIISKSHRPTAHSSTSTRLLTSLFCFCDMSVVFTYFIVFRFIFTPSCRQQRRRQTCAHCAMRRHQRVFFLFQNYSKNFKNANELTMQHKKSFFYSCLVFLFGKGRGLGCLKSFKRWSCMGKSIHLNLVSAESRENERTNVRFLIALKHNL